MVTTHILQEMLRDDHRPKQRRIQEISLTGWLASKLTELLSNLNVRLELAEGLNGVHARDAESRNLGGSEER